MARPSITNDPYGDDDADTATGADMHFDFLAFSAKEFDPQLATLQEAARRSAENTAANQPTEE